MQITDIEPIMLRLPEVRAIGDGCQNIMIILVHTDEGITGIGEAHTNPLVSKAILEAPLCSISSSGLKHLLVGEDPRDIERLTVKMRRAVAGHPFTKSGIEIALWDILGKVAGLPVYRLLGGAIRETVALGRIAEPNDIAPVVAFLASREGGWITGETIEASGGQRL